MSKNIACRGNFQLPAKRFMIVLRVPAMDSFNFFFVLCKIIDKFALLKSL